MIRESERKSGIMQGCKIMMKINQGETAPISGVIISFEDYHILEKRKEYLRRRNELWAKLNAGEDV